MRSTTSCARTARPSATRKRDARTDLTGRRALLTGGRAKIGMHIALRLLRDGAHTTITTRFPRDAVRRFAVAAGRRGLAAPAAGGRHRPARPGPGGRPRRRGRRGRPARHPDQQRRADGAPLPRRLRAAGARPSWRRCPTVRCPSCSPSGTPTTRIRRRSPRRSPVAPAAGAGRRRRAAALRPSS